MAGQKRKLPPWKCESPPPEQYDEADSDEEWPLEGIIAEEINSATHQSVYEVRWKEWTRPDGSNTTWYTEAAMNDDFTSALKEYRNRKRRYLNEIASESQSIDIYRYLDIHNTETWLEAQAYKQKLAKFEKRDFYKEKEQELALQAASARKGTSTPLSRSMSKSSVTTRRSSSRSSAISASTSSSSLISAKQSTQSEDRLKPRGKPPFPAVNVPRPTSYDDNPFKIGPPRSKGTPMTSRREKLAGKWNKIITTAKAERIEFVNEVDNEQLPNLPANFTYVESSYVFSDKIDNEGWEHFLAGCECINGCKASAGCHCISQNEYEAVGHRRERPHRLSYDENNLLLPEFIEVFECNKRCSCVETGNCQNRVAQLPRDVPIQIFKTRNGRGWGARSNVDVPAGKVLGFYAGTLLNRLDAMQESKGYTFDLDGREESHSVENLEEKFSVDAYASGNWTRFINHSCSPSLRVVNVTFDIPHIPYNTFVARYDIAAGTEFTIDYDPGAALRPSSPDLSNSHDDDRKPCLCESKDCRGWMKM